ncbi:MAG TPA: MoaD/ThiS family protein [Acidimicrobiia bacterium]
MTVSIKLPRMLWETINTDPVHEVEGATVAEALDALFARVPGLRGHIVDETGVVRAHVSVFVDGLQADLDTPVGNGSELRILHAVSGG